MIDDVIILENFEPFDGMKKAFTESNYPYANCGYNALLTVVNYFGKEIMPLINNIVFIYRFYPDKLEANRYFRVDMVNIDLPENVLTRMGIGTCVKSPHPDILVEEMTQSISKGNPVAICIDLYYQPGRTGHYQKKHGLGHLVLIYGYDLKEHIVHTIDDLLEYREYTLSIDDLVKGYREPFETGIYKVGEAKAYYEFILEKDTVLNLETSDHSRIIEFSRKMLSYQEEINESLNNLIGLAEVFDQVADNDAVLDILSSTIFRKCSEQYRFWYLCDHSFDILGLRTDINGLLEEIVQGWKKIRSLAIRRFQREGTGTEIKNKCKNHILKIYEKENEYNKEVFLLYNKWAALD